MRRSAQDKTMINDELSDNEQWWIVWQWSMMNYLTRNNDELSGIGIIWQWTMMNYLTMNNDELSGNEQWWIVWQWTMMKYLVMNNKLPGNEQWFIWQWTMMNCLAMNCWGRNYTINRGNGIRNVIKKIHFWNNCSYVSTDHVLLLDMFVVHWR